jgi:hypothetical protein
MSNAMIIKDGKDKGLIGKYIGNAYLDGQLRAIVSFGDYDVDYAQDEIMFVDVDLTK